MPKVKIQKTLPVQAQKLFAAVQDILTNDKELKALEPNLELCNQKVCDESIAAKISGSRIEGNFVITPKGDESLIEIKLNLPLMLSPFKGLVQKKIEEKLKKLS